MSKRIVIFCLYGIQSPQPLAMPFDPIDLDSIKYFFLYIIEHYMNLMNIVRFVICETSQMAMHPLEGEILDQH